MNKQRLFKIALWTWIGSVPFMLLMGFVADWLQRTLQPATTLGQIDTLMNAPRPPILIAANLAVIVGGLYMFLGWIPVLILGFMKDAGKGSK